MRLGIVNEETWSFFDEIYADLAENHQTTLFKRRTWKLPVFYARANRYLFHRDLQSFMRNNDVVFFEWASELLATATHLPKWAIHGLVAMVTLSKRWVITGQT